MSEKTVATPNAAWEAMAPDWRLCADLLGGTRAMRDAGTQWLPQEPAESAAAYAIRLNRSFLFPGFRRTVEHLVGKVFEKEIVLGEDVPAEIAGNGTDDGWAANVDLMGNNLTVFGRDVFSTAMAYGLTHILVDMPVATPGATLADERALGTRPYFVHIPPQRLIGWRHEAVASQTRLTQVRIRETAARPAETWDDDGTVERVRVLEPGRFRLFEKQKSADGRETWIEVASGITTLSYIPLVTVYTGKTGFMTARPGLMDLAWLNLAHWQSYSDQRNILRVARVPFLFGAGIPEEATAGKLEIGPNRMLVVSNADAKLSYVEHSGAGIAAGETDLQGLKEDMAAQGADVLARRPGSATATARAIDTAEADSTLAQWAHSLQDGLETALNYMAEWAGIKSGGGSAEVNDEFSLVGDQAELDLLLKSRQMGEISRETYLSELVRRCVLPDDFDVSAEVEKIAEEVPAPTDLPAIAN